ncbi:MAG: hypothetical protein V3U29_09570, partial [Phycisphaeraceae bacterium]
MQTRPSPDQSLPIAVRPGTGWRTFAMVAVVVGVACWTAWGGAGSLPLDTHEVFVARSTEEMIDSGRWLVPLLGGQPRLEKPPMQNWLAAAADRLGNRNGRISALEARLPSLAAGVMLVVLTLGLGCVVLDRPTAFVAALLVATSSGYVEFTHSARPEMLYAMWCTVGLLGLMLSARWVGEPNRKSWSRWAAWGGWAAFGFALLTKGPQLPLIMLGAFVVGMFATGSRGQVLRVLRPWSGLLILLAVALGWYVTVYLTVPQAAAAWRHELALRVSSGSKPWWKWLDPYYLYHTIDLVLPWVVLYPLMLALPWLEKSRRLGGQPAIKFLWCVVIVVMGCLSLAWGRRSYYLLPILGPMALLMAAVALRIGRLLLQTGRAGLW